MSARSPNRPDSIGMSIVRFIKKEDNRLIFEGVDMLDGTPVLDIKLLNLLSIDLIKNRATIELSKYLIKMEGDSLWMY
nr:TrmO family methyltransferase [Tepidanaerobacter syntrophicus]